MATTETPPIAPEAYVWRGTEHWRCPVCGRDSGDRQTIADHLAAAHPAPPAIPDPYRERLDALAARAATPEQPKKPTKGAEQP